MSKSPGWGAILMGVWFAGALVARAQNEPEAPPLPQAPKAEVPGPPAGAERGYLGAVVDDREDRGRGVRILQIIPGGPAEKAGLSKGDLITGVGGIRVRQVADFGGVLDQVIPGNTLTFEVLRGVTREKIDVVFGIRPGPQRPEPAPGDPRAPLDLRAPGSVAAPPIPQPPKATPGPKSPQRPGDDRARLEMLERRLEQLERRIEQLERAVSKQLSQ
jgi:membrane-associated protease RseP (regulator of RpoE activity)